jgi:hypothetical protein
MNCMLVRRVSELHKFCGMEAKTDVVRGPLAVIVSQDGFEEFYRLGENQCAVCWGESIQDAVPEGIQP